MAKNEKPKPKKSGSLIQTPMASPGVNSAMGSPSSDVNIHRAPSPSDPLGYIRR